MKKSMAIILTVCLSVSGIAVCAGEEIMTGDDLVLEEVSGTIDAPEISDPPISDERIERSVEDSSADNADEEDVVADYELIIDEDSALTDHEEVETETEDPIESVEEIPETDISDVESESELFNVEEIMLEGTEQELELEAKAIASGICGDNATWALDANGVLVISGKGEMFSYYMEEGSPWDEYNDDIKKVKVEYGITHIGDCAFGGCTNLTEVILPESVISLGIAPFEGANIEEILLPKSLKSIGFDCFYRSGLKRIKLLDNLEDIAEGAFMGTEITEIVIPEKVKTICTHTFAGCFSLRKVSIKGNLETIQQEAFAGLVSLTDINIPDTVKEIEPDAFYGCESLKSIIIPKGVSYIGENAFYGCKKLTIYGYTGSVAERYAAENGIKFIPLSEGTGEEAAPVKANVLLIAAYNGAYGIGTKWIKLSQATEYTIWQKYKGTWRAIKTVKPNDSSLQIVGNTIMYTDRTVQKGYGQGYIYSVSAKIGKQTVNYSKVGVAIYRLKPPTLTKVTNSASGKATITWKGVFGRTETNGAYDLQYATEANAKAGKWINVKRLPGFAHNVTSATVSGLKKGTKYVFRIRCSKTNKDRGTFYSEYSPWLSVTVKK